MKKTIGTGVLVLLLSALAPARGLTGVYMAVSSRAESREYGATAAGEPAQEYSSELLNLFASLYGENFFEVTLSLAKDGYLLAETKTRRPRYLIGFELGKVIGIPFSRRGRRIFSADFSAGVFYRFQFMGPSGGQKLYDDWGCYGACKLRIGLRRNWASVSSLDIGYKVTWPAHFSYYKGDVTVLTQIHAVFVGLSF